MDVKKPADEWTADEIIAALGDGNISDLEVEDDDELHFELDAYIKCAEMAQCIEGDIPLAAEETEQLEESGQHEVAEQLEEAEELEEAHQEEEEGEEFEAFQQSVGSSTFTRKSDIHWGNEVEEMNGKTIGCGSVTPDIVTAVVNRHFSTNLTVIVFDDFYYADATFKWILSETLRRLKYSAVMFGKQPDLQAAGENGQPSWVVFSSQMEAYPGRTLLISHNSPYRIKQWLITPMGKQFMDLIAISDPSLMRGLPNDCEVGIYTHSLNDGNFGSSSASILTSWRKTRFTQEVDLFPNKYRKGYKGAHFKIAVQERPPFTFKRQIFGPDKTWDGIEVRLISHLSKILNFTYELQEVANVIKGFKMEIADRQVELGIGRVVSTNSLLDSASLSFPHFLDCAAFMSLTSTALPKYRAIMGPFLWDVWLALTATYLLGVIPLAFSSWLTLRPLTENPAIIEDLFWQVFGTFTNLFTFTGENTWTKGSKCSTKLLIGTYWVFTIIITSCYTSSIIAFITLPIYPEVADSMHQLLQRNFRVVTLEKDGWWNLLISPNDDDASGLAGTANTVDDFSQGIRAVIDSANEDNPITFFASKEHLAYVIKTNYSDRKVGKRQMFHISQQCFVTQLVSFLLPTGSLHLETLNRALLQASESGVVTKIYRDVEWDVYKTRVRTLLEGVGSKKVMDRELTLDDTQGIFLLLGVGFGLAGIAWLVEVGSWMRGQDVVLLGKERLLALSRRVSRAVLEPTESSFRIHFPLYFRNINSRRKSSLFGSRVNSDSNVSLLHLKSPVKTEKPRLLLSVRIALIQMAIGTNKVENVNHAVNLIREAKIKGSNLVVLPECFNSPYGTKYFSDYAEEVPNGETCKILSHTAKENGVFIVGGSIPEREGNKLFNTCSVWNPEGTIVAKFRKVHLFDISVPGGITFRESDSLSPGENVAVFNVGACKVGLGICYDLRFVEFASLYRDMAMQDEPENVIDLGPGPSSRGAEPEISDPDPGVDLLLYPGAFNMTTGPLHWELLLRGRAVDNQMYVAGCCGARDESADYVAWGHSMLIDPWGKIVTGAQAAETTLIADIDLTACQKIRQQIPIRHQRRTDLYELVSKASVQFV